MKFIICSVPRDRLVPLLVNSYLPIIFNEPRLFPGAHTGTMLALVYLAVLVAAAAAQTCGPDNCKPPDCRCWDDKTAPGGLTVGTHFTPFKLFTVRENSAVPA